MKNIALVLKCPLTPNFIRVETTKGKTVDIVPIEDLTEDEIKSLGREWTHALLEKRRKKNK